MLFNLRATAVKIQCVKVYAFSPKPRNIKNYILSSFQNFDWDYQQIDGIVWNPKGHLDNREHGAKEAMEFSYVKEKEVILVTVPEFNERITYKFEVITSVGVVSTTFKSSNGKVLLPIDYRQTIT